MLKRSLTFAAVLLLGISVSAQAPSRTQRPSAPAHTPAAPATGVISTGSALRPVPDSYKYPNGQTLHYTAEWRLWNAGTATLKMEPSGAEQHVVATAESGGVVALLYRVQDRFESWFDRKTFCSSHIVKHSEEGFHKRETSIRFDAGRKLSVLDEKNLRNNETKHEEQPAPPCVTDVISSIYYVASLPLEVGQTYTFPLSDGGKTVDVRAHVEAREEIKTEAGTFRTIRVQPESDTGVLKNRGKVWIWYTDDAAHTPVQMRARLFWGTLTLSLSRIDHQ